MRHNAVSKKSRSPRIRAIDELVRNHKVGRLMLLFERPYRGDRKNPFHSQHLHREEVGAKVQLARQYPMTSSMPRKKSNAAPLKFAKNKRIRRIAKRRRHALFTHTGKSRHGVQATASDDANLCLLQTLCSLLANAARTCH